MVRIMNESCPLPSPKGASEAEIVAKLVKAKRIAVVGLSDDPSRISYTVASYLKKAGKEIVPVNPNAETVMGLKCYPTLDDVEGPIDLVNVFRRAEFCAGVARQAVKMGAKGLWLQSGIISPEARQIATEGGLDYVENRCLMVEHRIA